MTVLIILCIIVGLNLIGFAVNRIFFAKELDATAPYGQMVTVNGHRMHVYAMGDGDRTIVVLPGFGVALPSADFAPLMRELSKDYTVVCVEYFGTGFSDQVDTPRTNENYTEEIRSALSQAGYNAPYVLMPHSASGVYCEYYAAKYPDEVMAIVMLDTTATARVDEKNPPRIAYSIGKLQQATMFTRLTGALVPLTQKAENGYTEKEIGDYRRFSYHVLNDTIIDQSLRLIDNINEVSDMPFPPDIPVLKLISSQSQAKPGPEYQEKHLARLGEHAESEILTGTHFLYQTRVVEICEATKAFLEKVN